MIKEKEYFNRRKKLLKKIKSNSIVILNSSEVKVRSNDTEYPYRQNSNFYYLTGFKESNSKLVLLKKKKSTEVILFIEDRDKIEELWNGKRLGILKAKKRFLVDKVYNIKEFNDFIYKLKNFKNYYYEFSDSNCIKLNNIKKHIDISYIIGYMRLFKSKEEIKLIKKAIKITKKAHHKVMRIKKVNKKEYQIQAVLEYIFKKNGAYSDAYTSIVAGGNNANTLHYIRNNKKLKKDDLILIDAGCEYKYYASDITRTIPVNRKFNKHQKKVYKIVLNIQKKIIKEIRPGIKRSKLQKIAIKELTKGLIELKILNGNVKELIKKESYKKYYPHGIGHWLGLDVHDASPYFNKANKEIKLKKGMLLTIEPGLYIDSKNRINKKYAGIGIRIEDNILVTKNGYKNLSKKIKKSVKSIENP